MSKTGKLVVDKMDYEVIEHCKWGVPDNRHPEGESDCREPATHRVWWDDYEKAIPVCTEHFLMIKKGESDYHPCERQYLTKKDDRPGTCSEMDDKICPVELGER